MREHAGDGQSHKVAGLTISCVFISSLTPPAACALPYTACTTLAHVFVQDTKSYLSLNNYDESTKKADLFQRRVIPVNKTHVHMLNEAGETEGPKH
jgi:thiamine phosphate synthase YjbQ (UPF0047 family)